MHRQPSTSDVPWARLALAHLRSFPENSGREWGLLALSVLFGIGFQPGWDPARRGVHYFPGVMDKLLRLDRGWVGNVLGWRCFSLSKIFIERIPSILSG